VKERELLDAKSEQTKWRHRLAALYEQVDLLVTPTLTIFPPSLRDALVLQDGKSRCTLPANFAGVPALALPVPTEIDLPASIQLMGPMFSEDLLLRAGLELEEAIKSR
jgi:Asp-tRNA(Asn)/Glu-tRNA(Gln) amidotransferase A subunit family amidase